MSGTFSAGMTFYRDATVRRLAIYNARDLINPLPALRRQISSIKFKIYARQIDHYAPAGFARFDVPLFELLE